MAVLLVGCGDKGPAEADRDANEQNELQAATGLFDADYSVLPTIPFVGNGRGTCSGVLVDQTKFITARHCIFPPGDTARLPKNRARSAEVTLGLNADGYRARDFDALDGKPHIRGDSPVCESEDIDLAIFRLENDGDLSSYPAVEVAPNYAEVVEGTDTVRLIHFPGGGDQRVDECNTYEITQDLGDELPGSEYRQYMFAHDCIAQGGSSGAPLFNERNQLVAIHLGTANLDRGLSGIALRIPRARDQIEPHCLPRPQCEYGRGPNCEVRASDTGVMAREQVAVCPTVLHTLNLPNTLVAEQTGFERGDCISMAGGDTPRDGIICTRPTDSVEADMRMRSVTSMARRARACIRNAYRGAVSEPEFVPMESTGVCLEATKAGSDMRVGSITCPPRQTGGGSYSALKTVENDTAYFDIGEVDDPNRRRVIISRAKTADGRDAVTIASVQAEDLQKVSIRHFLNLTVDEEQ